MRYIWIKKRMLTTANASQLGIPKNSSFPMFLSGGANLERLVRGVEGLRQDAAKGVVSEHGSPAEDD